MVIVVMGVSGTGKTVVGRMLAVNLEVPFLDGDDFHQPEHLEQMQRGEPLDDSDRWPWLDRLNLELRREAALPFHGAVLACSALKASYRTRLVRSVPDVRFVHLTGPVELLRERLGDRKGVVGPELLDSQLATLEPPVDAVTEDVTEPPDIVMHRILERLQAAAEEDPPDC